MTDAVATGPRATRTPHDAVRARPRLSRPLLAMLWLTTVAVILLGLQATDSAEAWAWALKAMAALALAQGLVLLPGLSRRGWLEVFAYLFHWVFVGGACVDFAWTQLLEPLEMRHMPLALSGLAAQIGLGFLLRHDTPLRLRLEVRPSVLVTVMVLCSAAALVKFALYFREIAALGGHLAIYTDGASIRDSSPFVIRVLASGAPFVALVALAQRNLPVSMRWLAIAAIGMEFLIGTRSRPLFLLCCALALIQMDLKFSVQQLRRWLFGISLAIAAMVVLGYVREGYEIPAAAYMLVVFESLAGTVHGAVNGVDVQGLGTLVVRQLTSLLWPSDLSQIDTVARAISMEIIPAAYESGYGLSSSALLEIATLGTIAASPVLYPAVAVAFVMLVRVCVQSRVGIVYLAGIALMPTVFYLWRAELWQPLASLVKALPFLLMLLPFVRPRPASATSTFTAP